MLTVVIKVDHHLRRKEESVKEEVYQKLKHDADRWYCVLLADLAESQLSRPRAGYICLGLGLSAILATG